MENSNLSHWSTGAGHRLGKSYCFCSWLKSGFLPLESTIFSFGNKAAQETADENSSTRNGKLIYFKADFELRR